MANKEVLNIHTIKSRLSQKTLVDIVKKYHIDPEFRPCLPKPGNTIVDAPKGFVGVYLVFFRYGLRLPTFDLLERKRLASSALVTEVVTMPNCPSQSESSMDSTMNIDGQDTNFPIIPSPSKNVMKTKSDSRKLHSSSVRTALRSKRKVVGEKVVSL
ncbi:unnamed protein product [Lactuca virosa]|uniref:Uncharacterized protein n=1 Tax=Lactuca virosa TaxID=75947 RepID=A0AAU9M9U2_9ASTR|nr:unnamed protein product [Lactuca virosa]